MSTPWRHIRTSCLFTTVGIIRFSFLLFKLVVAMEELKQCRLQQRNISATVDKLTLCLPGEESEIDHCNLYSLI